MPDWLLNSAATYSALDYVEKAAAEMTARPERYGFDPASTYSIFVQTWDAALSPTRSVAFGRTMVGQEEVGLIPDIYYIHSHGYRDWRREATKSPPWAERKPIVAWRGSVTGRGPYEGPAEIPRVQLALAARDLPSADVALFDVHDTMAGVFSPEEIQRFLEQERLLGERWSLERYGEHRYVLDIDGHANAWGLMEKLIFGCCVLKVASQYEQWYYNRLRPWSHYVPVRADLTDLSEKIEWCLANPDYCAWIANNGALVAAAMSFEEQLPRSCETLLAVAHVDPNG